MDQFNDFLVDLLTFGGGSVAFSFLLFRFLGKSWIEQKFAQQLKQSEHDHALELQRFRVEIDSLLNGALLLQSKDFEILPDLWNRLSEAYEAVSGVSSPSQKVPNLASLTDVQLEEFFETTQLRESDKEALRSAPNRAIKYFEIISWHRLHNAKLAFEAYHSTITRHFIFFEPALAQKLRNLERLLRDTLTSVQLNLEFKDSKVPNDGWTKLVQEAEPIRAEVGEYIRTRLQSHAQPLCGSG